ncbi:Dnajb7, partial [Symbiodinium sp. CCMP2456]
VMVRTGPRRGKGPQEQRLENDGGFHPEKRKIARVVSSTYRHGNRADFYLDGKKIALDSGRWAFHEQNRRGFNIVTLDPDSQQILSAMSYDTASGGNVAVSQLATDLNSLPEVHPTMQVLSKAQSKQMWQHSNNVATPGLHRTESCFETARSSADCIASENCKYEHQCRVRVSKPSVGTLRPFEHCGASAAQVSFRLVMPVLNHTQQVEADDSGGCYLDGVRRTVAGGLRAHRHEGRRGKADSEASRDRLGYEVMPLLSGVGITSRWRGCFRDLLGRSL